MTAEPDLLPSSVTAFTEALKGERGSLDAWLEVNDECEVRAHVEAYVRTCVAARDAEIEALRAEVEMLRDAFSDEDMTAGAHWFGRYVEQKRRAEQLAEEVEALRAEVERLKALVRSVGYETLDRAEQAEARAERLAEALREAADMLLADYPETAKRMRAACCPTAAQENDDA